MGIETENQKYHAFYKMVKTWTINDFCTQAIRAEVIIDMMISEFIEEIIYLWLKLKGESVEIEQIRFLAKEFPIAKKFPNSENSEKKNFKNVKVDYLVINHAISCIYLVELKTTRESIETNQLNIYRNYNQTAKGKNLFSFFRDIVNRSVPNRFFSEKLSNIHAVTLVGSQKYITTIRRISKILKIEITQPGDIDKLTEKFKDYNVEAVYINLKKYAGWDKNHFRKIGFEEKYHLPEIALEDILVLNEDIEEYRDFEKILKQRNKDEAWYLTKELLLDLF